jgi:hypothetical protein
LLQQSLTACGFGVLIKKFRKNRSKQTKSMNLVNLIEKINRLPQNLKDLFSSGQPEKEIKEACLSYGIDDSLVENISDSIGSIILGETPLENLPYIIWENTNLEKGAVYGLSWEINRRIFSKFPEHFTKSFLLLEKWDTLKKNPFALLSKKTTSPYNFSAKQEKYAQIEEKRPVPLPEDLVHLPFKEALKKYPDIEQQLITTTHIMLPDFPEKVRPSIKNWLSDFAYYQNDDSNHEALINGYLFQSPNTKELPPEEKTRLKQILISFNNNAILTLNRKVPEIIFDEKFYENFETARSTAKSLRDEKLEKEASQILKQLKPQAVPSEKESLTEKTPKIKSRIKKAKKRSLTEESAENFRGSFRIKTSFQESEEKKQAENDEPKEVDYKKLEEAPFKEKNNDFKAQETKEPENIVEKNPENMLEKPKDTTIENPSQESIPASPYAGEQNWQNNVPLTPLRITPYYQGGTEEKNPQPDANGVISIKL